MEVYLCIAGLEQSSLPQADPGDWFPTTNIFTILCKMLEREYRRLGEACELLEMMSASWCDTVRCTDLFDLLEIVLQKPSIISIYNFCLL